MMDAHRQHEEHCHVSARVAQHRRVGEEDASFGNRSNVHSIVAHTVDADHLDVRAVALYV